MVCPAASDCSTELLLLSVKVQPTVAVLLVSANSTTVPPTTVAGVSANVPILSASSESSSAKPGRSASASVDFSTKSAVWVSIRSTSLNVIVPPVDKVGVAASSVTAPVAVVNSPMIVGAWFGESLAPVIVTVTSSVTVAPLLSVNVTR